MMKGHSGLYITSPSEEKKVKEILLDSAGGSGFIKKGAVEEKKLKWLI